MIENPRGERRQPNRQLTPAEKPKGKGWGLRNIGRKEGIEAADAANTKAEAALKKLFAGVAKDEGVDVGSVAFLTTFRPMAQDIINEAKEALGRDLSSDEKRYLELKLGEKLKIEEEKPLSTEHKSEVLARLELAEALAEQAELKESQRGALRKRESLVLKEIKAVVEQLASEMEVKGEVFRIDDNGLPEITDTKVRARFQAGPGKRILEATLGKLGGNTGGVSEDYLRQWLALPTTSDVGSSYKGMGANLKALGNLSAATLEVLAQDPSTMTKQEKEEAERLEKHAKKLAKREQALELKIAEARAEQAEAGLRAAQRKTGAIADTEIPQEVLVPKVTEEVFDTGPASYVGGGKTAEASGGAQLEVIRRNEKFEELRRKLDRIRKILGVQNAIDFKDTLQARGMLADVDYWPSDVILLAAFSEGELSELGTLGEAAARLDGGLRALGNKAPDYKARLIDAILTNASRAVDLLDTMISIAGHPVDEDRLNTFKKFVRADSDYSADAKKVQVLLGTSRPPSKSLRYLLGDTREELVSNDLDHINRVSALLKQLLDSYKAFAPAAATGHSDSPAHPESAVSAPESFVNRKADSDKLRNSEVWEPFEEYVGQFDWDSLLRSKGYDPEQPEDWKKFRQSCALVSFQELKGIQFYNEDPHKDDSKYAASELEGQLRPGHLPMWEIIEWGRKRASNPEEPVPKSVTDFLQLVDDQVYLRDERLAEQAGEILVSYVYRWLEYVDLVSQVMKKEGIDGNNVTYDQTQELAKNLAKAYPDANGDNLEVYISLTAGLSEDELLNPQNGEPFSPRGFLVFPSPLYDFTEFVSSMRIQVRELEEGINVMKKHLDMEPGSGEAEGEEGGVLAGVGEFSDI